MPDISPTETATADAAPRDLQTIAQFSQRFPAWSQPSLRNLILNSRDRITARGDRIPGNGLTECGAILRVGRKVLLSPEKFFRWVAQQQKRAKPA